MKNNDKSVLQPVFSEKAYALAASENVYTFNVPRGLNKIEIKKLVADEFNVDVVSVRIVTRPGKVKRDYKTYKPYRRSDKKYAYVKLKDGSTISGIYE